MAHGVTGWLTER